jgi:hypothetical protein
MPKVKARKLDAATEQQAIASARNLIELRGGLSHKHSQEYWHFWTKAELHGRVDTGEGERFLQRVKDVLAKQYDGKLSISFLPGPGKWNETLAEKLIADVKQGDANADQVLREVAAEYLKADEKPPKPLAHYAGTCLWPLPGRKKVRQQPNSSKPQSHKTDYRDWILALTVDDVAKGFRLKHTRNRETQGHCACSIVALATKLSEKTVQNVWHDYEGVADQRTATNYVPQAMVTVTYDAAREYWPRRPRVVGSDGTQEHFLVRFPRVGSAEAMSRPSNRKAERVKRAKAQRAAKRASLQLKA